MVEIALVLGSLVLLAAGSLAWSLAGAELILKAGVWMVIAGFAFGLPTGAVYHVTLHRSLARAGRLPRRWWLHPTSHHRLMPREDAAHVLAWCRAGAAGCGLVFLGCAVVAFGAFKLGGGP